MYKTKAAAVKRLSILKNEEEKVQSEKQKLEKLIENFDKPKSIMDSISNFDDIVKIAITKKYIKKWITIKKDEEPDEYAYRQLKLISRVLNDGWKATAKVNRYFPYFSVSSGFVFTDTNYDYVNDYTDSGFRLALENPEKAKFSGTTFVAIWKVYITG